MKASARSIARARSFFGKNGSIARNTRSSALNSVNQARL